ncbi:MAG: gamma-glutamyl-gamma-aminobutyrate hydrolase family protein [Phycisphaerales bacterium]|nr:gamma-glutamyl-gamma-aminobutyrate hydrolase family protein [Phycisphaerales bacterium]
MTLSTRYSDAVYNAGGLPFVLPPSPNDASNYLKSCDGLILSGGSDVIMEDWGVATHPSATPISRLRQDFELGMLAVLESNPDFPVLAICLGMQLMGITHGARFSQHLPEDVPMAENHLNDSIHEIEGPDLKGCVTSHHHQALLDGGSLQVIATSPDGVVEGIADLERRFYVGVQWHPERTDDKTLGAGLFRRLIQSSSVHVNQGH